MNIIKVVCLSLAGLLLAFANSVWAGNHIKQIRSNSMDDKVQIVIDVTEKPDLNVFALSKPVRLVVDIKGKPAANFSNNLSFKNRGVSIVRTGTPTDDQVRVVLDLVKDFRWKAYAIAPQGQHGHRIVVDVFDYPGKSSAKNNKTIVLESATKAEKRWVAKKTPKKTTKPKKPLVTIIRRPPDPPKAAKKVRRAKPPALRRASVKRRRKAILVMIDPGHGGKDSGAIGPGGTYEKRVVLQIAKRLRNKINAMPGMRAMLTRNSDRYITLRGRLALARKYKPDLFVSIHADAVRRRTARGSSVFILSNRGASSEAAKILAQGQNAVDRKYGVATSASDDVGNVLLKMQQDATIESSHALAGKTLRQLKNIGSVHKRYVERAGFAVLKSPNIPSMLVETAFISNPEEERKLRSPQYQNRLATAIARGIKNFFDSRSSRYLAGSW
ncbi:MAG: N-acetylmuramoyl-L-alanine amidase [Gammaproteobacteria bacterium]|nr:MAG: N-acetylmuramoyl-L-alanine amidase [Gammaproteobacteria bacterium]